MTVWLMIKSPWGHANTLYTVLWNSISTICLQRDEACWFYWLVFPLTTCLINGFLFSLIFELHYWHKSNNILNMFSESDDRSHQTNLYNVIYKNCTTHKKACIVYKWGQDTANSWINLDLANGRTGNRICTLSKSANRPLDTIDALRTWFDKPAAVEHCQD